MSTTPQMMIGSDPRGVKMVLRDGVTIMEQGPADNFTQQEVVDAVAAAREARTVDVGCCYQHTKTGRFYMVVGLKLNTETSVVEVIYDPLYAADLPEGVTGFARPLEQFTDRGGPDGQPRFKRIRQ